MTTLRRRACLALLVPTVLSMSACSGGGDSEEKAEETPTEVLAAAKKNLDDTTGVHIVLSTDKLPGGVNGILNADGFGTHAPAFQGTLKVVASGITADVPVVAVDDIVYAQLPFTTKYAEVDPADYGAPNPATLLGTENGLSALLSEAMDLSEGKQTRDGSEVLSSYTGSVPGEVVASIIPSTDPGSDFDVSFTVSEDDVLSRAVLTGPFYPKGEDVTYTVSFDQYGTEKDITAP